MVGVPLLREGTPIGVFGLARYSVKPFTAKQIELVETFADQAVIAIENARLLNELSSESLEQQTATSEVLKAISSSPGDLQPVFAAMLENAVRICDAKFGNIYRWDGDAFNLVATHNTPPALAEARKRSPMRPDPKAPAGRMVATKTVVHIADLAADPGYIEHRVPAIIAGVELGGIRTLVTVPMLKENKLVGALTVYRQEVRPFTDKQIELLTNFAAQAVIAIENTRLLNELRQRTTDLTELLEQQTATSEVLQVISSSPGDVEPVFQAMLENAVRICDATFGNIYRWDGENLHLVAANNTPGSFVQARARIGLHPGANDPVGRMIVTKAVVHTADLAAERDYIERRNPGIIAAVEVGGVRTLLAVPLLKDNQLIGSFHLSRQEVRPFTKKQITLVTNFAAQAVIAIENARLLTELHQRTTELTERTDDLTKALEQQTATSEVLQVISSSPGELQPVFDVILDKAVRICRADTATLFLYENGTVRRAARHSGVADATMSIVPSAKSGTMRSITTKQIIHIPNYFADPAYLEADDYVVASAERLGIRASLHVPMLREQEVVGAVTIWRKEARAFTEKQIDLIANFAAQAVIAIENTRLLNELRQRTDDLTEILEQQTATSKVLDVISRSVFDLHAVFETVAESSVRLCGADRAYIFRFDGEVLQAAAAFNASQEHQDFVKRNPIRPGQQSVAARAALERRTIHIPDVSADSEYTYGIRDIEAVRTVLGVPILKGDALLGVLIIYHLEVRPFTDNQIALVETFADQAAIAIENVRLLDALRHRTDELGRSVDELRALGEVSQAVNSTLDLETVLTTIVAKAVQLSGTEAGAIYVFDDRQREFHLRATYGMDQELIDALTHADRGVSEPNIALILAEHEPIQVADLNEEAPSELNEITLRAGYRARLVAPLIRGEDVVGLLVVRRRTPGAFPQNTVDLIKTFAAQSAVAIENARLFQNVEASLEDLRTAQDRLVQTEKLASLGQLTAGIAHEIKNPLNFVNNFSAVSVELIDELREALGGVHLDSKLRAEISEIADTLQGNLDKVVQHGKRADAIVKNMLLHSRQGSGEHRPVDINALVDESLNLAYHGARAEKQGFNITLERSFDPAAGEVDLFPQEITRVLLNLISNGFYAATKRKAEANGGDYEPTLAAATKNLGDSVEIRIRDNGTGIPPEVREKLFNPFFTTKPAGEGTGLGLSISHDIIVKQHGGSIEVDTQPGEFTEFQDRSAACGSVR